MLTTTLETRQSDLEKLRSIAQRSGKSEGDALHELLIQAENSDLQIPDENDPEEQAVNNALRSPEVRGAFKKLQTAIKSKNLSL